jgi:hypothetical protein
MDLKSDSKAWNKSFMWQKGRVTAKQPQVVKRWLLASNVYDIVYNPGKKFVWVVFWRIGSTLTSH